MTVSETAIKAGARAMLNSRAWPVVFNAGSAEILARACLTAALSNQAGGWQDISTAPKDGTRIEYHNGRTIDPVIGYCRWATWPEDDLEDWWDYERDCEACPKFWRPEQPLPAPPPSSTAGEGK